MMSNKSQKSRGGSVFRDSTGFPSRSCRTFRNRTKQDWAGTSLGDAFNSQLDYYLRIPAQRQFYRLSTRIQVAAGRLAGDAETGAFEAKVKPQLGPCYSSYPSTPAAHAAIGLTGFLEFRQRAEARLLSKGVEEYVNLTDAEALNREAASFRRVTQITAESVETRFLLEDLRRTPDMSAVEIYRLFSASQQQLRFQSLREIINAVILYGDVLPDRLGMDLHPMTRSLLNDVSFASSPFLEGLKGDFEPVEFGMRWVKAVCSKLLHYLPPVHDGELVGETHPGSDPTHFGKPQRDAAPPDRFAPLNGPNPPTLFDEKESVAGELAVRLLGSVSESDRVQGQLSAMDPSESTPPEAATTEAIKEFCAAVEKAGAQNASWQDMRSDLVEQRLRQAAFNEGPIQGHPTGGREVTVRLSRDDTVSGEVFDRPVPLSDHFIAYQNLARQADPVTEALKRSLYPNIEELPQRERFQTSGGIDPSRLALYPMNTSIFRRYRAKERPNPRGRAVLLIACDGSGSLNHDQMMMTKVLVCAWLNATVRTDIEILAALYHSGPVREGVSGPLVQWIYHPRKTPAIGRKEAARALVSLPNSGTGAQSDALSIVFMLEEARRVSRGATVYLVLISDCAWNRCLGKDLTGCEEVQLAFESSYEECRGKLDTTLVAVGVEKETGLETLLDKVVTVPVTDLKDYARVAGRIGRYVARCVRERKRLSAAC